MNQRFLGFRPGAAGLPDRTDFSRDVRTILSSSAFGTAMSGRMTALKRRNSGVARNSSAVRPRGGGAFLDLAALDVRPSAIDNLGDVLADHLLVREPAPNDVSHDGDEPFGVRHLPRVEPKGLLVQVPEQVERFDTHVRPAQRALQERPEVFQAVRVDLALSILLGVVNHFVDVVCAELVVGRQRIGEHLGPRLDVLANLRGEDATAHVRNVPEDHAAMSIGTMPFEQAHDGGLPHAARSLDLAGAFRLVHEAGATADEGFVGFDVAAELGERPALHGEPDALEHKPCGLLRDAERTVQFVTADPVFAVNQHPRGGQPLFERDRRVLEDGPGLEGERRTRMARIALPHARLSKPCDLLGPALRTLHRAVRPAQFNHELPTMFEVGEVEDRVPKRGLLVHCSRLQDKYRPSRPVCQVYYCPNILIDFISLGCLERILHTPSHKFWLAENVKREILDSSQRQAVQAALDAGLLTEARVEEPREIELYAEMRRFLGDGEAASLAIAESRGWGFVSYEGRKLAREATRRLGATRFLTTPQLLAQAVRASLIDLDALREAAANPPEPQAGDPPRSSVEHLSGLVDQLERL